MDTNLEQMRLDRFLSGESGYSRSEIRKMIKSGLIRVNGESALRPDVKVKPGTDDIRISGKQIRPTGQVYLLLNKPQGVLSATEDRRARTVLDLIREPFAGKLFPVGRLDKDTEGLLLLTNDGMLAHNLLSPKKHVYKVYFAVVEGEVTREDEQAFLEGIDIGEKNLTMPAVMRRLSVDGDFLWTMKKAESAEGYLRDEASQVIDDEAKQEGQTAGTDMDLPAAAAERSQADTNSRAAAAEKSQADKNLQAAAAERSQADKNSRAAAAGTSQADKRAAELSELPLRMRGFCLRSLTLGDYSRCGQGQSLCAVALREGKFHQIKRMFEARGKKVAFLKRVAMGPLVLDQNLAPGQYRRLTEQELEAIRQ